MRTSGITSLLISSARMSLSIRFLLHSQRLKVLIIQIDPSLMFPRQYRVTVHTTWQQGNKRIIFPRVQQYPSITILTLPQNKWEAQPLRFTKLSTILNLGIILRYFTTDPILTSPQLHQETQKSKNLESNKRKGKTSNPKQLWD